MNNKLTDEQLIKAYRKQKDKQAFDELFGRYSAFLKKRSWDTMKKTGLDFNVVHSKYIDLFWKAVKKYNPKTGASFKTFLRTKFKTAAYDVVRAEKYRKKVDEDGHRLPKEQPLLEQETLNQIPDYMDLEGNMVVQDIFNYLRSKNPIYATVLNMILQGYKYEEIGKAVGRHGSPEAIRNWVKRVKAKIAQHVLEYYGDATPVQRRPFPQFEVDGKRGKRFSASLYKHQHEDPTL